jgi:PmbA protein
MKTTSVEKICKVLDGRVDEWEVSFFGIETNQIEAKDGKIETLSDGNFSGISVRIIKDKKLGFAYTPDENQFKNIVEEAIAFSKYKSESRNFSFYREQNGKIEGLRYFDKNFNVTSRTMIEEVVKNAVNVSLAFNKRIKKVRKSVFLKKRIEFHVRNSHGVNLTDERSDYYLMQEVIAEHNSDSTTSWAIDFSHFFKDIEPERVGRESAENAVGLLGGTRLKTGEYPAVIKNLPASELIGILGKSFLSEHVFKNKSQLKDRINEKIFADTLTIIDSGLIPQGWNSFSFDGEGVVTQENILIDRGVLMGFLYDNYYGNIFMKKSTGNCRRDEYSVPPKQDVMNLYIKPGNSTLEELLRTAYNGIFITALMGVHTVNPITGDFSLGAEGYLLKNGSVSEPFRGVTVSGNLFELFKNVALIGSDLRFLFSSGSPSLFVNKIVVGGN